MATGRQEHIHWTQFPKQTWPTPEEWIAANPVRVAFYMRAAGPDATERIRQQRAVLMKYGQANVPGVPLREYCDNRPRGVPDPTGLWDASGLPGMLSEARKEKFNLLLVTGLDRLSRSSVRLTELLGTLADAGVNVRVIGPDGKEAKQEHFPEVTLR